MTVHREPAIHFGQGAELLQALIRAGLTSEAAQNGIENRQLAAEIVRILKGGFSLGSTPWTRATQIMGNRAVGIDVASIVGVKVSRSLLPEYATVPFSERELEAARDGGLVLVAMPEMDLLGLRKAAGNLFSSQGWYEGEVFAKSKSRPGYCLFGKLPGSDDKNWNEQLAMIPEGYGAVPIVEMAYVSATTLFRDAFAGQVRCVDLDSYGNRCIVGNYGPVTIDTRADLECYPHLGVAYGQYRPLIS